MRCEVCGSNVGRWSASPLCPACHAAMGHPLPVPAQRRGGSGMWLWTHPQARTAAAGGQLGPILRAYRAASGTSQRQLADPARLRHHVHLHDRDRTTRRHRMSRRGSGSHVDLGLPVQTLLESRIPTTPTSPPCCNWRIRHPARGRGPPIRTTAPRQINELWPLVTRLEKQSSRRPRRTRR